MKGYLIAAVFATGLMVAPAMAQSPTASLDITSFSPGLLNNGMETMAVCSGTAEYGIRRFLKFYEDNKTDSTSNHNVAAVALNAAVQLYNAEIVETQALELIAATLNQKHKKPMPDLIKVMTEAMTAASTSLHDKYDSLEDFGEFTQSFQTAISVCDKAMNSIVDQAEKENKK